MRKLATVQRIVDIKPIPNADSIECARVLGWDVVVKKDQFKVGDLCVYVEIDSILPEKPQFEFMKNSKGNMQRVKTIKLRGQISQGIVFPLNEVLTTDYGATYSEGKDVTDIIGVTKWEPDVPANLRGKQKSVKCIQFPKWMPERARKIMGKYFLRLAQYLWNKPTGESFPSWLPKTDETRVQNLQSLLKKYEGIPVYISEKIDGSSISIYLKDGEFGVCSRNIDLKEEAGNSFWDTVRYFNIEERMREMSKVFGLKNFAIQGELVGPGIQGNKYKLTIKDIYFFNFFDIDNQKYFDYKAFVGFMKTAGLKTVPILTTDHNLVADSDYYLEMAKGKSILCDVLREGIVIRPLVEQYDYDIKGLQFARVSFKAINNEFLLRYND